MRQEESKVNSAKFIGPLFWIAAAYDGLLGAVFLAAPLAPFDWFSVTPPNHAGYVQFPAMLLIIFGLMFAAIALDPPGKRVLIPYGILLKAAYSGIVFYYWFTSGVPGMWKSFAVIDVVMGVLFVWAYVDLAAARASSEV
jgi:hypothetical protein